MSLLRAHRLYPEFLRVKQLLKQHQFVCWVAGGAVRDLILQRECSDFDLVTDASTENLKAIFPEALLVGEQFGVLKLVLSGGDYFDLTTFRQESDYEDGRRPSQVSSSTPTKDAGRRDFTVNALFWDDESERLIDFVGGQADLQGRILKAVGDPQVRFSEDYLRMLRLVRFAAQLDFAVDPATEQAAFQKVSLVDKVSGERVWAELKKLKTSAEWNRALSSELFKQICQEIFKTSFQTTPVLLESRRDRDAASHLFFILSALHFDSAQMKEKLVQKLHLSREEQSRFELFVKLRGAMRCLTSVQMALELEKKPQLQPVVQYVAYQKEFDSEIFEQALELLKIYPQALVNGEDLKSLIDVRQIGHSLNEIRMLQFEGKIKTKEQALAHVGSKSIVRN